MPVQFDNTSEFIRWNEAMTQKYDSEDYHLRSNFMIRWIEKRRVQAVVAFLQVGPDDTVVEIGCGAGVVLEQIPAGRRIGLDLSGFILQKTKRRLSQYKAHLMQANAERLPFANESFDHLLCTEVIEHVLEPREVVREMARVGTAVSTLVITIPNETLIDQVKAIIERIGLTRWLLAGTADTTGESYDSPSDANEWHLHQFDLDLLRQVTADFLQIEAVRAIPFSWLPFRYVVKLKKKL